MISPHDWQFIIGFMLGLALGMSIGYFIVMHRMKTCIDWMMGVVDASTPEEPRNPNGGGY